MREIKFRAWDGEKIHPDVIRTLSYCLIAEDITVEQYTGIKDKNGVDIYDGDYIKAKSTVYKIEWFNTAFWAIPESGYGSSQPISSLYEYEDGMAYKVEVIGNIHENPDLLEEQ